MTLTFNEVVSSWLKDHATMAANAMWKEMVHAFVGMMNMWTDMVHGAMMAVCGLCNTVWLWFASHESVLKYRDSMYRLVAGFEAQIANFLERATHVADLPAQMQ